MSNNKEISERALKIIANRRYNAEIENKRRTEEINRKIPEIAEINHQLANAGIELFSCIKRKGPEMNERIERIKRNNLDAQMICRSYLKNNGYSEDYLDMKYSCESCNDTGFVNGSKCKCLQNEIIKLSVNKMNETSHINLTSFETFNLNYYSNTVDGAFENMSKIYQYCLTYANSFSVNSDSLFMIGKTGLGKTHLSLAIAKTVLGKGYNIAYDSVVNYFRKIEKEHFGRADNEDTLDLLINADLVILDDLGTENKSSFYESVLYTIINSRINRNSPTIINSNLPLEQIKNKYDERIISRLFTTYNYLKFSGNDVRWIKKQAVTK